MARAFKRRDKAARLLARPLRAFDFDYQLERHLAVAVRRWPKVSREKLKTDISALLKSGQAWLYPEPEQGDLFAEARYGD